MDIVIWFKLLLRTVSNRHLEEGMDRLQVVRIRLMNQYVFVISLIFAIDAFRNLFLERYIRFSILFLIGVLLFLLSQYTKIYFNRRVAVSVLVAATLIVFYFCSGTGLNNGIVFYYFAILFASLFVFADKNRPYHIFLFLWIFALFYIVQLFDHQLFDGVLGRQIYFERSQWAILIQGMMLLAVNGYFIMRKNNELQQLYFQALAHEHTDTVPSAAPMVKEKGMPLVADVVKLAKEDNIAFIPAFKQVYPDFYKNLSQVNPEMTKEEFKFCALLKLGFTTKDIANYNHLAVRSVQTKKNRLRKSFHISPEEDLYSWIDRF